MGFVTSAFSEIAGCRRKVFEAFVLLGCYAADVDSCLM
jgi:hypothetical protein